MSKYGVISGPHFHVVAPEITPYLDTFHVVNNMVRCSFIGKNKLLTMLFKDGFLKFQEHNLGYHFNTKKKVQIDYTYKRY